jgi:phage gp36-like protein
VGSSGQAGRHNVLLLNKTMAGEAHVGQQTGERTAGSMQDGMCAEAANKQAGRQAGGCCVAV